jgi:hypothetical protein
MATIITEMTPEFELFLKALSLGGPPCNNFADDVMWVVNDDNSYSLRINRAVSFRTYMDFIEHVFASEDFIKSANTSLFEAHRAAAQYIHDFANEKPIIEKETHRICKEIHAFHMRKARHFRDLTM